MVKSIPEFSTGVDGDAAGYCAMGVLMSLSIEDVRRVAELARLGMDDAELAVMHEDLSSMLEHINLLHQIDTDGVAPTIQVTGMTNIWREDEIGESLSQETAIKNAAASRHGFFAVSAIMGGDEGTSA